jgi:hypothetical protein
LTARGHNRGPNLVRIVAADIVVALSATQLLKGKVNMSNGWIGVDLDGTLAVYNEWGDGGIGEPVPLMLERVKRWLAEGYEVRIVTARVGRPDPNRVSNTPEKIEEMRREVEDWTEKHVGQRLQVTNEKDYDMLELWDDRVVQVEENTGRIIGRSIRGL